MKIKKYRITAETSSKEYLIGTVCYNFCLADYGCAAEDTRETGVEHVAMTLDPTGDYPLFTVPGWILRSWFDED